MRRARVRSIVDRFARLLEGRTYALGGALTALDIYIATAIAPFAPMSEELCPDTHPIVRHAFATASPDLSSAIPPVLIAHRDRICWATSMPLRRRERSRAPSCCAISSALAREFLER